MGAMALNRIRLPSEAELAYWRYKSQRTQPGRTSKDSFLAGWAAAVAAGAASEADLLTKEV